MDNILYEYENEFNTIYEFSGFTNSKRLYGRIILYVMLTIITLIIIYHLLKSINKRSVQVFSCIINQGGNADCFKPYAKIIQQEILPIIIFYVIAIFSISLAFVSFLSIFLLIIGSAFIMIGELKEKALYRLIGKIIMAICGVVVLLWSFFNAREHSLYTSTDY